MISLSSISLRYNKKQVNLEKIDSFDIFHGRIICLRILNYLTYLTECGSYLVFLTTNYSPYFSYSIIAHSPHSSLIPVYIILCILVNLLTPWVYIKYLSITSINQTINPSLNIINQSINHVLFYQTHKKISCGITL